MFGYDPDRDQRSLQRRRTLRIVAGLALGAVIVFLALAAFG